MEKLRLFFTRWRMRALESPIDKLVVYYHDAVGHITMEVRKAERAVLTASSPDAKKSAEASLSSKRLRLSAVTKELAELH